MAYSICSNKNNQPGFTLIELLVVISIIGLLASVLLVAINNARVKSRDTKRAADLKQIRTALELYQQDNGHYPITNCSGNAYVWSAFDAGNSYVGTGVCASAGGAIVNASISAALSPYLKSASDPKRVTAADSGYLYTSSDGIDFKLMAWLTPENMNNFDKTLIDYSRCGTVNSSGQCSNNNAVGFWSPGGVSF